VCPYSFPSCLASKSHSFPCCIISSSLWPLRLYHIFVTLSHKQQGFREKLLTMKCVFWFFLQLPFETFLILRIQQEVIMYVGLHVKCTLFLSDFNETWILSEKFRKIVKYQMSWKSINGSRIIRCGETAVRTDGRTDRDMTKQIVVFRSFVKAPWRSAVCP
jgi:hypothetical protein